MRSFLISTSLSVLFFMSSLQSAQAVNIAIVDTGLDPGILGGVIEPGGFDFFNNDDDPSDESPDFHGTSAGNVAINSGNNITLTPIKIFQTSDGVGSTSEITSAAFNFIAGLDNVRVVSHDGASITNTPLSALQAVTNSGKIIVLQAGNFAGSSPAGDAGAATALGGRAIVAGGATADGQGIQDFSNRAGNQQDFFILANTNSLITSSNGTSMATPRVAAAAATVIDAFGFLSPEQVVQILLNTATDLGEPGVDPVFGHGFLNLPAALSAAGEGNIPDTGDGGGGGGGGGGLGIAALAVGGVAAYALLNKKEELQRTVLVDEFGRAFTFNFANRIQVNDHQTQYLFFQG